MDGPMRPSSTTVSPSSSVFRPRRSDDWQEYRSIIEQLYRNDQLKLKDVKRIMERDYNFVASEKQYKDRLAAWHVRKNIKAKEVHVMHRKQMKRAAQGKRTAFRVGGQQVDSKRIQRMVRKYGATWENARDTQSGPTNPLSPEPATPSDMSCYTPEPDEIPHTLTPETSVPEVDPDTEADVDAEAETEEDDTELPASYDHKTTVPKTLVQAKAAPPQPAISPQASHAPQPSQALQSIMLPFEAAPASIHPVRPPQTSPQGNEVLNTTDSWVSLASFQHRLLLLHKTLESSMQEWSTPHDEHYF